MDSEGGGGYGGTGWVNVGLGLLEFLCMGWSGKECKTWVPGSWLDGNGTFASFGAT